MYERNILHYNVLNYSCTECVLNDSNNICFVYDLTSSANSPTAFVYND